MRFVGGVVFKGCGVLRMASTGLKRFFSIGEATAKMFTSRIDVLFGSANDLRIKGLARLNLGFSEGDDALNIVTQPHEITWVTDRRPTHIVSPAATAVRQFQIRKALRSGAISYDSPASAIRAAVDATRNDDGGFIERLMAGIVMKDVQVGELTALVYDVDCRIPLTVDLPSGASVRDMLHTVAKTITRMLPAGRTAGYFSVQLLPRGQYGQHPLAASARSVPLGRVRISEDGREFVEFSASESSLWRDQRQRWRAQSEKLDVQSAEKWSTREVIEGLRYLHTEIARLELEAASSDRENTAGRDDVDQHSKLTIDEKRVQSDRLATILVARGRRDFSTTLRATSTATK